jgi:hypothetical protein
MKTKAILITLALCVFSVSVFAVSPHMGTWNLNETKSKFAPGAPKNTKVVYEAAGNDIKVTVDGVDGAGAATHNEWTGRFNGKCYDVTGDPTADQRCYKTVNAHKLLLTNKKAGNVILTGTIVVSANGKTRTVTTNGTDANGKRVRSVAVYDRE